MREKIGALQAVGFTPEFCQAMEAVFAPAGVQQNARSNGLWHGFPWLTLLLGSGCLVPPADADVDPAALADAVVTAIEQDRETPFAPDAQMLAERARAFAQELVEGRVGDRQQIGDCPAAAHEAPQIDPLAAPLVVLAMLLTEFFHGACSTRPRAISRWDNDEAQLDPINASDEARALQSDVIDPAVEIASHIGEKLADAARRDDVSAAVAALMDRIVDGLRPRSRRRPPSLRIELLRLTTEVSWCFVVRQSTAYAGGWTDLLVRLMLREGERAIVMSGRPRPRSTTLAELPNKVRELVAPAMRASWKARAEAHCSDNATTGIYDAAAQMLWAQADAAAAYGRIRQLPPAVAYVTSFDVELDMAVCAHAAGREFSVALPVHLLQHSDDEEAEFCWLHGTVAAVTTDGSEPALDRLCRPMSWRLLTPQTSTDELYARPTIVHLSGCPLFELPSLIDEHSTPLVEDLVSAHLPIDRSTASIDHAITVDEYVARCQAEAELLWTSRLAADSSVRPSRALHPRLLRDDDTDNPRFWMAIGVPMTDPAIRQRVAAQLTIRGIGADSALSPERLNGAPLTTSRLGPRPSTHPDVAVVPREAPLIEGPPRADVNGVAVNLRIDNDEAALLYWLGLDVVEDDCRSFVNDLLHYVKHVCAEGDHKRALLDRPCPLVEVGGR